jgi:hypothetical protein
MRIRKENQCEVLKRLDVFMQNVVGVVGAPISPWASPAWVPAGVIVALAVGLPLVWLTWRLAFARLELIYSILEMPFSEQRAKFAHEIRIYDGTSEDPLREPQVVRLRIINKSSRDIPTTAFDDDRPLTLDLGATIIAILGKCSTANNAAPTTTSIDSELQILPTLIRRKDSIIIDVLVDGPIDLSIDSPLIDAKLLQYPWSEPFGPWWKAPQLYRALTLIVILLLVFLVYAALLPEGISSVSPNLLPVQPSNSGSPMAPQTHQPPKRPQPKPSPITMAPAPAVKVHGGAAKLAARVVDEPGRESTYRTFDEAKQQPFPRVAPRPALSV